MKKKNYFTFKNGELLCWRLGPMNNQKQRHFNRDMESYAGKGTHKPPESRGVWAFPWPHYDFFFCWHQWKRHLPKKYQLPFWNDESLSDKEVEQMHLEIEKIYKKIQKRIRPTTFYADKFYSHIFPNGKTNWNDWYYWDSPRDWAKIAQKTLYGLYRYEDKLLRIPYSKDHLEIFVVL